MHAAIEALGAGPGPLFASSAVVIAVDEESEGTFTGRTAVATAELLGRRATVFPSHHVGFLRGELATPGGLRPFARRPRAVLDGDT